MNSRKVLALKLVLACTICLTLGIGIVTLIQWMTG